jgi:hypothetical protein
MEREWKGKIEIVDECLAPESFIWLKYTGPSPWSVVGRISDLIRPFFHVSASGTNNTRINWDIVGDSIGFYSEWWVKKKLSAYSNMWVDIRVIGNQHKVTKQGEFILRLKGDIKTEFKTWTFLLRPFFSIYNYIFYNRVRMRYVEQCRQMVQRFRDEVKEHFNLQITEMPAGVAIG